MSRKEKMEMKDTILLIDDEKLVMNYYVNTLEAAGFEVKRYYDTDTTFEFIEKEKPVLAAIIIDIMMVPGKKFQNVDTQDGLKTGVHIYNNIRSDYADIPIIILTNVTNKDTLLCFKEGPLTKVVHKIDYPPSEFTQLLREMINNAKNG